jgi:hypothetical protein
MKLVIELVPSTCWYTNVRSNVSNKEWDILRKMSYLKADNKCEICKDNGLNQGFKHRVECHEVWEYNDVDKIQKLISLISLCPRCHQVKHIGLSKLKGFYNQCIKHLCVVNDITENIAIEHIEKSFKVYENRSRFRWKIDISYLDVYLNRK